MNKFKTPFIADLEATDDAHWSSLLPKVNLLVNLVTDIIAALFNEQDFKALLELVG